MVRAFRADVGAALELPRVDQLATARALDPQVLRDLQIAALLVRFFGTKLAPALEKIPHRRHGAPFRGVSGSLENGRISRSVCLGPTAYGTSPARARPGHQRSADGASGD